VPWEHGYDTGLNNLVKAPKNQEYAGFVACIMMLVILLACWPPARRAAGSIQLSLYATTSGWYSGIPLPGFIPSKRKLQVRSTISIVRSNPVPAGGVY
jgi:hypothetical protein